MMNTTGSLECGPVQLLAQSIRVAAQVIGLSFKITKHRNIAYTKESEFE